MKRSVVLVVVLVVAVGCAGGGDHAPAAQNPSAASGGSGPSPGVGGAAGTGNTAGTAGTADGGTLTDALPTPAEPTPILTNGASGRFALVNPENGDIKPLCPPGAPTANMAAANARWSPDKTAIVGDTNVDIVIMSSTCENRTVLTKNSDQFGTSKGTSHMPRFVGDKIIFIQKVTSKMNVPNPNYDPALGPTFPGNTMTIEKTVVDGMELMSTEPKLTSTQPVKVTDFRRGGVGVEAFDIVGSTVCYRKGQLEPPKDLGVYCADWPTLANERKMTERATTDGISMSPDGKRVAFRTENNGKAIEAADTKAGGSTFLAGCMTGIEGAPQWAPDGKRLAYSCNSPQDQGLYVVNSDGMNARQLSREAQAAHDWR